MQEPPRLAPTLDGERIDSLDVLRGVAVLGILTMNIISMAMIEAMYFNPHALGEASALDYYVWLIGHLVADQKFLTIFSILFGAGVVIFAERLEGRGRRSAGLHYRRMAWLLLFGMLHAYLLWFGDILFTYALCGMLVYLLRRLAPPWLLLIAALLFLVPIGLNLLFHWSTKWWPEKAIVEFNEMWAPTQATIEEHERIYRGPWLGQLPDRIMNAVWVQTFLLIIWTLWRVSACMLLGMALLKLGVLAARRSRGFYASLALIGLAVGMPVIWLGVRSNMANDWIAVHGMFVAMNYNYIGSILVALAWIALVMLVCQSDALRPMMRPFAAVGRTAFTNYIMQTVICTTIFYGHGFGLYGTLSRGELLLIILAVWIAQLVISPLWLRFFRFGPLEWLWRSLTYWRAQPLRRAPHHSG